MENLQIRIFIKENFTDGSIIKYLYGHENFTAKKYSEFLASQKLQSELAENIITFICT
jgi:hypothetical protein